MAQSLVSKRQNIATKAVAACTQLWDAMVSLQVLQIEAAQAGNFVDADFADTNLSQLTGYMVGLMVTTVTPGMTTLLTTALPNGGPVPRDILLQMRS